MERFCNTFSVSFYCRGTKANKQGLAPVEMGINYQGERFFINTTHKCRPDQFKREMSGKTITTLKQHLITLESQIRRYETECLRDGEAITINGIKEYIRNGYQRPGKSVRALFNKYFEYLGKKLANGLIIKEVYQKYERVRQLFVEYTKIDLDRPATAITTGMVTDFCNYLDANYMNSTSCGFKMRIKSILAFGRDNGFYQVNPFQERIIKKEVQIVPLTEDEVERIMKKDLSDLPRLDKVRDLFVFACFTGLAYADTQKLTREDIMEKDGTYYINKERQKTGVEYMVVLLPPALEVLQKYDYELPRISNQKLNSYLGELEDLCRIKKRLHFHLARHTAACLFLNKYHFKTEVTAKIMGHKSLRIAQHYQKMFSNTVMDAFKAIM